MQRLLRGLPREMAALSWAARRAFEAAVEGAMGGRRAPAEAALSEALAHDPEVPAGRLIAAQVRYGLRQYQRALDELDAAARLGAASLADELRWGFTARLGWNHEAREVIERRAGSGRVWNGRAVQLYGHLGRHHAALEHLERLRASSPASSSLELNAAHLAARAGAHAKARRHALAAVALEPERASLRTAAAQLLGAGGFAAEAFEHARAAMELSSEPAAHAVHAELSLWVGDLDAASQHAERCLDTGGQRIRGAIGVLRGAYESALADLDEALIRDSRDASAHVWRAEALLRTGRFEAATEAADRALGCSEGHPFAAQVIRLLATLRGEGDLADRLNAPSFGEILDGCTRIAPDSAAVFAAGARGAVIEQLELVLGRLGGNRSDRATWLDSGSLEPLTACEGVRFRARAALDAIRIEPLEHVLGALDDLRRSHPESGLPLAHRGEVNLWMGHYDAARADLEGALSINPFTRWAYIGMTMLEILAGRYDRALEISALGVSRMQSTGPAVYVHRGEAYRRAGELDRAVAELETARRLNPSRLGATINLALAYRAKGDAQRAGSLFCELVRRAPGLLSDAALAAEIEPWQDAAGDGQARLLERALELMRGNRSSSCQTYLSPRGAVRTVPTGLDVGPELDGRDLSALAGAAAWLAERRSPAEQRRQERSREPHRDVELIALAAGLRTAVRVTVPAEQVEAVCRRHEEAGLVSLVSPTSAEYGGEHLVIVYAARAEADARRALDAENALESAELGRLLGYPPCCVRAFVHAERRDQFEAARAAWVARPLARLNTLLFGAGVRLLSFEPCRFDCARAAAVADAIAAALAAVSAASAARCDTELARSVAIDASDARALVTLDAEGVVTAVEPVPSVPDRPIGASAVALAQRLLGARVGAAGRALVDGAPEVIVHDFGWPSREL